MAINQLLNDVRHCTICSDLLTHGVRPVIQFSSQAKILIAGQAPGSKAHSTGIAFNDPSGDRLRNWMGLKESIFYDSRHVAILPMSFCYPGKGKSGDLPPLSICSQTWREKLLNLLPNITLTLVIGQYAQKWHLENTEKNLTETVRAWRSYRESILPLPHPSPRNNIWLKNNPWFEADVLPELKRRVQTTLELTNI